FFFSSRRRHTRSKRDWSSDVCSSDLSCRRNPTLRIHHRATRNCLNLDVDFLRFWKNNVSSQLLDVIYHYFNAHVQKKRADWTRRSEERRVGKERRRRGGQGTTKEGGQ